MPTLDFKGKQHVYAHHLTIPWRPLKPDPDRSVGDNTDIDGNLIIHGDNLHALKALLPRYAGRINCIYIDPPYNTGNENWVYNDNVNSPHHQVWFRQNSPVDGEDLERHDKWLCMMWPRLMLLHQLLSDDGIIFLSINDHEQHHLRVLMNEIFGEENFYSQLTWESRTKPTNMGRARFNIQSNTESIIVYGKISMTKYPGFKLYPSSEKEYPYHDVKGKYRLEELQQRRNIGTIRRDTMVYPIEGRLPKAGYRWQMSYKRYQELSNQDKIIAKGQKIYQRIYESSEDSFTYSPFWSFINKDVGTSESGKQELNNILGLGHGLETVKPTSLIRKLLYHCTDGDSIILDSFAGSGTTGQAVVELNNDDNGNRKYILVECEEYADSITAERVRRVISGVPDARDELLRQGIGGSFTYCTLGDPITVEGMLTGQALPTFATLATWLLHTASGTTASASDLAPLNEDGLFYVDDKYQYYLLYKPDIEYLRGDQVILNEERARRIGQAVKGADKSAIVFAADKYLGQRDLSRYGVTFCQLPYELHRHR